MKKLLFFFVLLAFYVSGESQQLHVSSGLAFQKTEALYWENGIIVDISSDKIFDNKIHFKLNYLSSRLGSVIASPNSLKQDNIGIGAHWYFFNKTNLNLFAGLNSGLFLVDYENPVFDDLPSSALLIQPEAGVSYRMKIPLTISLSAGYNLRNGNGIDIPGSLFPVIYKCCVVYRIK